MPTPATVAEFIDVIRKSGLVAEEALVAQVDRFPHTTIDQFTQELIRAGLLTKFQSKQLKLGRYKRFEIAGKYRLLELLGIGGMGAVYLCEHVFMKRLVALKVLPHEKLQDPSTLHRFYREARAVAALDHPNIVRAFDIDKYETMHFLVMEYVDGTSVQEIVARYGTLSPIRAANYVAQTAHGLHHASELGLVHRDIKPGNLLLERTGVVKILDMGLAKFFDQKNDNVTEKFDNNCVLGTADYLAPEQAVSNVVDIRADIYALGGSFYFMLTGRTPFPDGTIAHKLLCHQTDDPRPVTEFRKDVPPALLAILHKMMRKDPAERYQTPEELFDDLTPWINETAAIPPTTEMPELCPAVLALTGHANDRAKGATRLGGNAGSGPKWNKAAVGFDPGRTAALETQESAYGDTIPQRQAIGSEAAETVPMQQSPSGRRVAIRQTPKVLESEDSVVDFGAETDSGHPSRPGGPHTTIIQTAPAPKVLYFLLVALFVAMLAIIGLLVFIILK